jgi:hypothetical protein
VVDRQCAREVGQEDDRRPQRRDEDRLAAGVVRGDDGGELLDARVDVLGGEVDVADARVGN